MSIVSSSVLSKIKEFKPINKRTEAATVVGIIFEIRSLKEITFVSLTGDGDTTFTKRFSSNSLKYVLGISKPLLFLKCSSANFILISSSIALK